jgi:predicted ATPase/DNA-binding XRE family transcriptional regulator
MTETYSFGAWLRQRRKALDMTQRELANRTSCALATIKKIEADERRPSKPLAQAIARQLDLTDDEGEAFVRFARGGSLPPALLPAPTSAALRAIARFPTNLPRELDSFIGREREIKSLRQLLVASSGYGRATRLVTLIGPGGVGKTRLAVQAVSGLLDRFEHGVFFVDLTPIVDADRVATTIAQVLDLRETGQRSPHDSLKQYLRDRQILLLLDNFEQILGAAALISDLLATCPRLQMLITSREALHLRGEKRLPVPPLAVPDPGLPPGAASLVECSAVKLLIERAVGVNPEFAVTDQNAAAVSAICTRVDGLPLALELAAARLMALSPQDLLVRLEQHVPLLSGGSRDAPARHQTIRGVIDWSYHLLSEAEKMLFRRLGVFVGGWTLQAAEVVCTCDDESVLRSASVSSLPIAAIPDLLSRLVEKSLVIAEERDGSIRYRMLETIREYACARLDESGEYDKLGDRHLNFYLEFAETAEPHLMTGERVAWVRRLQREHDNLSAALHWSQTRTGGLEKAYRLVGALRWFWTFGGSAHEGLDWSQAVVQRETTHTAARAKALYAASALAWNQSHNLEARRLAEESAANFREVGDALALARALRVLGNVAFFENDLLQARRLHEESEKIFRQQAARWDLAMVLQVLGSVLLEQGDQEGALARFKEGEVLSRGLHDFHLLSTALRNLTILALRRGDLDHAGLLLREALTAVAQSPSAWSSSQIFWLRAVLSARNGNYAKAARLWGVGQNLSASGGTSRRGFFQEFSEQVMAATREALGEKAFEDAQAEGKAMSPQQAIAYALAD